MKLPHKTSYVTLITGCSSRIGKELARAFAGQVVTVLATARRTASLDDLTSHHDNIESFPLDLDGPGSIDKLRDAVMKRTDGRLDFLVNNAGTHYASTAVDLEIEEVVKLFQVNVFAVMRLCQVFVPLLCQAPRARIVQISSVTRSIPVELVPLGIEVVEIVTGFVQSNILHHGLHAPENSLYLPIENTVEHIKYEGNKNGMPAQTYATSVVAKLMQPRINPEIWEGALNWILLRRFTLDLIKR
ncbi:hypothetical protein N7493_007627 [Penicillium malachiteum]|uniref:Uncharacterized protein n=1 Tax=Penicillium malachiteum TaxID=1324776 RepID=A0AAD6MU57_9EURO|nr:hypothetical protein N7493_007627 [Penicillium malachiteum]